ncbi:hypothetical protein ACIBEJ_34775 [Nonomuraea sp. NPDC050790]|uniref:hypothetical protein n=1 Tax=Nonomuraea sp. NPDC050790 TaxID=3364371 RepID=UPI0037B4E0F6
MSDPDKTSPEVTDLLRELAKAREALAAAETHLARHAEANAALHASTNVMYSPLHAKVAAAIHGIDAAHVRYGQPQPGGDGRPLPTLDHRTPLGALAAVLADLDRCMHGRHEVDTCSGCKGPSRGNFHMPTGSVIGYGRGGDEDTIVMPPTGERSNPRAWRPAYASEQGREVPQ